MKTLILTAAAGLMLAGCETVPELVNPETDAGHTVMGLDYRDFVKAATNSVENLLSSGCLNRPGRKYVLVVSRIVNKTQDVIDTDLLAKRMRARLMKSGKVVMTTAYGINGPEDQMTALVQEETGSSAQSVLPELSLSGKIISTRHRYDSSVDQIEYSIQFSLTDLNTGLAIWEDEQTIVKRGSSRSVTW